MARKDTTQKDTDGNNLKNIFMKKYTRPIVEAEEVNSEQIMVSASISDTPADPNLPSLGKDEPESTDDLDIWK